MHGVEQFHPLMMGYFNLVSLRGYPKQGFMLYYLLFLRQQHTVHSANWVPQILRKLKQYHWVYS